MNWRRKLLDFDNLRSTSAELTGLVFDIQKFATHDGGGIRTVIFLKGCPLSCAWCANPESITATQELTFIPNNCIGCEKCLTACPQQALALGRTEAVMPEIDRIRCTLCGECLKTCYPGALNIIGRHLSVAELLTIVERDRMFYQQSGGGVTFSGGEPLMQVAFLTAALQEAKRREIHTSIETSAFLPWDKLRPVLQYVDLALVDLKHMDEQQHLALTGVPNRLILDNLRRMAAVGQPLRIRLPLVPGCNDSEKNMRATAEFIQNLANVQGVDILPYHRLGVTKWSQLDRSYRLPETAPPSQDYVLTRVEQFQSLGVEVTVGG